MWRNRGLKPSSLFLAPLLSESAPATTAQMAMVTRSRSSWSRERSMRGSVRSAKRMGDGEFLVGRHGAPPWCLRIEEEDYQTGKGDKTGNGTG